MVFNEIRVCMRRDFGIIQCSWAQLMEKNKCCASTQPFRCIISGTRISSGKDKPRS